MMIRAGWVESTRGLDLIAKVNFLFIGCMGLDEWVFVIVIMAGSSTIVFMFIWFQIISFPFPNFYLYFWCGAIYKLEMFDMSLNEVCFAGKWSGSWAGDVDMSSVLVYSLELLDMHMPE